MENLILAIHIFLALGLIFVILIQPPESGGLGGLGGSNPLAGVNKSSGSNILTRATAILATLFIITSLTLAVLASHKPKRASILDAAPVTAEAAVKEVPKEEKKESKPSVPLSQ
jgi:preprotein translocase subunit SecG